MSARTRAANGRFQKKGTPHERIDQQQEAWQATKATTRAGAVTPHVGQSAGSVLNTYVQPRPGMRPVKDLKR